MTLAEIEHRLSAVEAELAKLKASQSLSPPKKEHPVKTLNAIHGIFAHDEAFEEAMRLGRKWRQSQDTKPRNAKARSKAR